MQASLTRKPWQAIHPKPPTGRNLHNREEPQTARIQKGHRKHSNINKMKRQRNTQQVKEHDKCPPNQIKEEEIGSLHEKEIRIMRVKMIQNLNTTMHFFHHPKVHRRETHLDHPSIPVPCSNLKSFSVPETLFQMRFSWRRNVEARCWHQSRDPWFWPH